MIFILLRTRRQRKSRRRAVKRVPKGTGPETLTGPKYSKSFGIFRLHLNPPRARARPLWIPVRSPAATPRPCSAWPRRTVGWRRGATPWRRSARCCAEAPGLAETLGDPVHTREERREIVAKLADALKLEREPANLLLLLADRNRLDRLVDVLLAFGELADANLGRVRAHLTSAVPLAPGVLEALAGKLLGADPGHRPRWSERSSRPSWAARSHRWAAWCYDGSVRTQLEDLGDRSRARARRAPSWAQATERTDGHPRRRDQQDHPRADQGLRQEGRRRRDRNGALAGRRGGPHPRALGCGGRRAARVPGRRARAGAEPRGGQRRRRHHGALRAHPRGRPGEAYREDRRGSGGRGAARTRGGRPR